MAKGKAPESNEFKAAYEGFCSLSEEEQTMFRSKVFSKICNGLTKEQRNQAKSERKALLNKIECEKKIAAQLQAVSTISTETLENILAERKKSAN